MEEIKFRLSPKLEQLAIRMAPEDYAQMQTWEKHRDKINAIVRWINEHEGDHGKNRRDVGGGDPAPK